MNKVAVPVSGKGGYMRNIALAITAVGLIAIAATAAYLVDNEMAGKQMSYVGFLCGIGGGYSIWYLIFGD